MTDRLPAGTRVRLTQDVGGDNGVPGRTGTIVSKPGGYLESGPHAVQIDGATSGGAYSNGVYAVDESAFTVIESVAPAPRTLADLPVPWSFGEETVFTVAEGSKRYDGSASGLADGARVNVRYREPDGDGEVWVLRIADEPNTGAGYVKPEDLLLEEAAAEQPSNSDDLAAFKELVRSKVIAEATAQGWCGRVDGWLAELGLPTRYADLPNGKFAVVKLKDGRHAVLTAERRDRPWRFSHADGSAGQRHTSLRVVEAGIETVISTGDASDPVELA